MRETKFIIYSAIIFLGFFGAVSSAKAAEYYVATNGNDANPGTISQPWQHIAYATCAGSYLCPIQTSNSNKLKAGDTLYIRGGTYNEYKIRFTNSGAAGNVITVRGYSNETAIIDGGRITATGHYPVFDIDGVNYITLDGLTIKRGDTANIYIAWNNTTTNITIKNCDLQDFVANDNSGQIYINTNSDNILIENNKLHGAQGTGGIPTGIILFHGDNITIRNNEIFNNNTTGGLGGTGIMFKHNNLSAPTTLVENNLIYNHTRYGMLLNRANAIVKNNIIHDITGGQGILVFEESAVCSSLISDSNQILHNSIVDVGGGVKLDRSSSCVGAVNTIVRDNLIYNCTDSAHRCVSVYPYYSTDTSNTTFDHNLIYSASFTSPIRVLANYFTTATIPSSVLGGNNIQQAPVFVDYANNNFALASGSPGKNAASDGADMGANVSLVGLQTASTSDTTPPSAPSGLVVQ